MLLRPKIFRVSVAKFPKQFGRMLEHFTVNNPTHDKPIRCLTNPRSDDSSECYVARSYEPIDVKSFRRSHTATNHEAKRLQSYKAAQ